MIFRVSHGMTFFHLFFRLSSPEKEIALETLDNVIKEAEISLNNSHNSASAPQPQRYEIFVNFFVKSISRNFLRFLGHRQTKKPLPF